jgi:hypothetical protein
MSLKESVLSGAFLMLLRTHKPPSDGHMRTELEVSSFLGLPTSRHSCLPQTRMVHCKPAELLLAEQGLTKPTERMLKHFAGCVPWITPVHKDLTPILSYQEHYDRTQNSNRTAQESHVIYRCVRFRV